MTTIPCAQRVRRAGVGAGWTWLPRLIIAAALAALVAWAMWIGCGIGIGSVILDDPPPADAGADAPVDGGE